MQFQPADRPLGAGASLKSGIKVEIHGLQSAAGAKLNGIVGHCLDFNASTGRWGVRLSDGTSKAFKPENLAALGSSGNKESVLKPEKPEKVEKKAAVGRSGNLDLAISKRQAAAKLQEKQDLPGALRRYDEALAEVWVLGEALTPGDLMDFVRDVLERKAWLLAEQGEWCECLLTILQVKMCCQDLMHDMAALLEGYAFAEIGLLENSAHALDHVQKNADAEFAEQAAQDLQRTRARQNAVDKLGNQDLLKEEVAKLCRALPEKAAREWQEVIMHKCKSKQGQEECISNGFLQPEWLDDPLPRYTLRATHRALLFQVKKKVQNMCLPFQVAVVSPESLRCGRSAAMLQEAHWKELRKTGLVVIDDVFDTAAMEKAFQECLDIDRAGLLKKDPDDLCNPDSRSIDVQMSGREAMLPKDAPVLKEVMTCMRGLAVQCEEKLGLKLRVPQTTMLSCYGPGAYYRRHMDSYDGKDIPRKITVLLYTNPYWKQSDEGCLRAWVGGEPVDYSPLAGRLIIFMAQEIPHEVLESKKDRYCITQWIWDEKKDEFGR